MDQGASRLKDVYQLSHLANQTDGAGTLLASFTYDQAGIPVSVQIGSDPSTAPRYYYVYNAHGDVTSLTDTSGAVVANYLYDSWGALTSSTETFANGWSNPYRYDGRDGARYDASDGLYWLSVRAYDPSVGRFLSRDPLGRAPLFGVNDNPYVYAGNNPLSNVDPSGQRAMGANAAQARNAARRQAQTRVTPRRGNPRKTALHAGGLLCAPSDRGCMMSAITSRILWLITVLNFGVELVTTIAAIVFAVTEISEVLDGDLLQVVNLAGDASTALSGLVALLKDGALLFGWGGKSFQEAMTFLTMIAKALSTAVNLVRTVVGGLALLSIGDPGQWVRTVGQEIEKNFMPQVIKAIVGGLLFGGADFANGGVAGLQYLRLTLPNTPTQQLPGVCQFLGAQC